MTSLWLGRGSLLVVLGALALTTLDLWPQRAGSFAVDPRVLYVKGGSGWRGPGRGARALAPGETIPTPATVNVPEAGEAALSLVPGVMVWATGATKLDLIEAQVRKRGETMEERSAQVLVEGGGAARFAVGAPTDRQIELRVETAGGEIVAGPDALFSIVVPGLDRLRLTCARGSIRWSDAPTGQAGWLLAGYFQECREGRWDKPTAAALEGAAQEEILNLLSVGQTTGDLQRRLQSMRPERDLPGR